MSRFEEKIDRLISQTETIIAEATATDNAARINEAAARRERNTEWKLAELDHEIERCKSVLRLAHLPYEQIIVAMDQLKSCREQRAALVNRSDAVDKLSWVSDCGFSIAPPSEES